MLGYLISHEVKIKITIDDIRLSSNLTTNKTIRFTKKNLCPIQFWVLHNHIDVL